MILLNNEANYSNIHSLWLIIKFDQMYIDRALLNQWGMWTSSKNARPYGCVRWVDIFHYRTYSFIFRNWRLFGCHLLMLFLLKKSFFFQTTESDSTNCTVFEKCWKESRWLRGVLGGGSVRQKLLSAAIKLKNSHKAMWHRPFSGGGLISPHNPQTETSVWCCFSSSCWPQTQ